MAAPEVGNSLKLNFPKLDCHCFKIIIYSLFASSKHLMSIIFFYRCYVEHFVRGKMLYNSPPYQQGMHFKTPNRSLT